METSVPGACHGVVGSAAALTAADGGNGADGVARMASCLDGIGTADGEEVQLAVRNEGEERHSVGVFV